MLFSYDPQDLDARPTKGNAKVRTRSSSSISTSDATDSPPYDDEGPPRKRQKGSIPEQATKVVWSDSDGEDAGAAAFKKFKTKKSNSRKQALRSTRKAKAIDAENNPPPKKCKDEGHTGVGRQAARRKNPRTATYDSTVPSDEAGMDHTLPDYLQERRNRFSERSEKLKEAGLALPPNYDDVYFSDNERLRSLKERPNLPNITPPAAYKDIELPYSLGIIPAPVAQYLRDYQVKGAAFLHELFVYQKGGILGDDMGLGKTIQVIAFLTAMYGKTGDERDEKRMRKMRRAHKTYFKTLIICPGSLMANWQDELNRWGWWHSELFHGLAEQRDRALDAAKSGYLEIMVTTYTTYRLHKGEINTVLWDCVIADECHTIKERKSEVTKAMNEVNSLCRIGLTGTAIQNKYEELWTILNWSSPGTLGPISTWKESICNPLKVGQSHNATIHQLARARTTAKLLVRNLLPRFFLRRMKTLIKDELPEKSDRVVFCPLTALQAEAYQNFLESDYVQKIKNSSEICDCGSGKQAGWCCGMYLENGDKWQHWVFPCLQYLQRLCNHLALLIPGGNDDMNKQAKDVELLTTAMPDRWKELVESRDSMINYSNPEFCGKWRILKKLLKFWDEQGGNKVLVFSHSVKLLRMLQALFLYTDFNVKYLDGSMSYEDRYAAVNDFNTDPTQFVFLISTKAGGVGLNITSANKVVIVDPNWNPSYDLQAQDRAYRIGQTRNVEVFRLVSQGTLEEIVYARQIYKQQMSNIGLSATDERRYFAGVMGRKDQKGEIFGLRNMFAYQDENVVLRDIVHKTNVAEAKADLHIANLEVEEVEQAGADTEEGEHSESHLKEEEDEGLSQLAQEIIGEPGKNSKKGTTSFASTSSNKHDPIQAILASAGVSYTHENSEVVGSSRVEAALSKRAAEASTSQLESRVFMKESQSQVNGYLDGDGGLKYRYRPPEDVMRRQFGAMAKWAGFEDAVEFALVVESWTQADRRDFLDKWYWYRRECMVSGVQEYVSNGRVEVHVKRQREAEVEPKIEVVESDEDDEL